jgi:uncharacterized Zn-finger protein
MAEMELFGMKVWLDVALVCCPRCGHYFVDASWYVVEMESDIECGYCGIEFNSVKNATDRAMLEFELDEDGKMQRVKIVKHLNLK